MFPSPHLGDEILRREFIRIVTLVRQRQTQATCAPFAATDADAVPGAAPNSAVPAPRIRGVLALLATEKSAPQRPLS